MTDTIPDLTDDFDEIGRYHPKGLYPYQQRYIHADGTEGALLDFKNAIADIPSIHFKGGACFLQLNISREGDHLVDILKALFMVRMIMPTDDMDRPPQGQEIVPQEVPSVQGIEMVHRRISAIKDGMVDKEQDGCGRSAALAFQPSHLSGTDFPFAGIHI